MNKRQMAKMYEEDILAQIGVAGQYETILQFLHGDNRTVESSVLGLKQGSPPARTVLWELGHLLKEEKDEGNTFAHEKRFDGGRFDNFFVGLRTRVKSRVTKKFPHNRSVANDVDENFNKRRNKWAVAVEKKLAEAAAKEAAKAAASRTGAS